MRRGEGEGGGLLPTPPYTQEPALEKLGWPGAAWVACSTPSGSEDGHFRQGPGGCWEERQWPVSGASRSGPLMSWVSTQAWSGG